MSHLPTKANRFKVTYVATTDKPAIVNLSHHSHFKLGGEGSGTAFDHELKLNSSEFTPTDANQIAAGESTPVQGTAFDFREQNDISRDFRAANDQIRIAHGYDHNFAIDRGDGNVNELVVAAEVADSKSGRTLTISTTEPDNQFYSGNFLNGSNLGISGRAYPQGDGFALETQHFPDSPIKPGFPTVVLRPGEEFLSQTVFAFSW